MIRATYRLQLRGGTGFREAARIVPHLAAAGISHLYASPVFAATDGSAHGYDVTDPTRLDPVLGTEEDFEALASALAGHGMGLILDIVPNHMAASPQNPWWRDVLKHGRGSRYADHFDIDWSAGRIILPILGKPYGTALAEGDITRADDGREGPVLRVPGHDLPLAPGTEGIEDVHALHEAQHYRVAYWRLGRDGLTYRRFFEITGLVGVRVEDPAVFDDVHRLVERLVAEGKVAGVRVDHVDGLADPAGYLERLAGRLGVPVLVEKILEGDERLRPWPVAGTTGYEFIAAMAGLFTDRDGLARLARDYGTIAEDDVDALCRAAKRQIVTHNLAGELATLTQLARTLFGRDLSARDRGPDTVREGIATLIAAMPVYRTYIAGAASEADRAVLAEARGAADTDALDDPAILDDLLALLTRGDADPVRADFVTRFQQTTGPAMAKAVEDTLFYRHHRLVGLNEVGGSPEPETGTAPFLRVARTGGLATTGTHDTKRAEDARARLYALSDPAAADLWAAVWPTLPGELPERLRWALAQMLFAAAPLTPDPAFTERFREAALKTVREAKQETSWTRGDPAFEARVAAAAEAMAGARDRLAPLEPVWRAGAVIALSQAILKVLVRPAPDIYQGGFGWDFSMVDPDNRRPVDFDAEAAACAAARAAAPEALTSGWADGRIKARVLLEGLAARGERPGLFRDGDIKAMAPSGEGAGRFLCLVRQAGQDRALAVVPLRPLGLLGRKGLSLTLPETLSLDVPWPLTERFTGRPLGPGPVPLSTHMGHFPVLLATSW